jgi:hypothetical protein
VHQHVRLLTDHLSLCSDLDENTKTHGTDDVTGFGEDYITAARDLLSTWVNNPEDLAEGALAPYQNAENIAAAATGKSLVEPGSLMWSETNTDLLRRELVHQAVWIQGDYSGWLGVCFEIVRSGVFVRDVLSVAPLSEQRSLAR